MFRIILTQNILPRRQHVTNKQKSVVDNSVRCPHPVPERCSASLRFLFGTLPQWVTSWIETVDPVLPLGDDCRAYREGVRTAPAGGGARFWSLQVRQPFMSGIYFELMTPILASSSKKLLLAILESCFKDNQNAYLLQPDGSSKRIERQKVERRFRMQDHLTQLFERQAAAAQQARSSGLKPHLPKE